MSRSARADFLCAQILPLQRERWVKTKAEKIKNQIRTNIYAELPAGDSLFCAGIGATVTG
jgi:hypothetical protein